MHVDVLEIVPPLQLSDLLGGVAVAGPVEAVALHPVLLVPLVGHCIELAPVRHIAVKCRLETPHPARSRRHSCKLLYCRHISRIVRGRQRIKILHAPHHVIVQLYHPRNAPRMHRLKSHRVECVDGFQHAPFSQPGQCLVNSRSMIGEGNLLLNLLSLPDLEFMHRPLAPDAIHPPPGEDCLLRHREYFVLKRSTPQIRN